MYLSHTNISALRSKEMITDALLRLMGRKSFSQITVTEICDEAGVGRKTFYRNFELKEDVIAYKTDCLCSIFEEEISGKSTDEQLYLYFSFSKKHVDFFSALYQNGLLAMCRNKFSRFLPDTMPRWSENAALQEYCSRFTCAGIEALMQLWVERSFEEDIDTVVALARRIQTQPPIY